jgi:hypothetical protein
MSSLPLISHRLYVAAIGSVGGEPAKHEQNQSASTPNGCATAIPLELMATEKSTHEPAQPLRMAQARSRS